MKKALLSSAALVLMCSPALAQQPSCRSVPVTVLLSHYENPPAGYTGKGGCIICVINDVAAQIAAMRPAGKVGASFAMRITTVVEQQPDGTSKVSLESETPNTEIDDALPKERQNEAQREIRLLEAKLKRFSVLLSSRTAESDAEQASKIAELFSHLRLLERPDLKIELCDPAAADSPMVELVRDPQTGEWTIVRKMPNGEEIRTRLQNFVSEFGGEIVRETGPNGEMRESVLWPDGTVTTLRDRSNGGKEMTTLTPSGQLDHVEMNPDGTFSHQTSHPDGTLVTEHRRADGSLVEVVTQHPDGWVERRDPSGAYQAVREDGDKTTIVEADRSGNVHTATFDRNGNPIESASERVTPQEPGRKYFEEKLGGRDWDQLPKSLKNRYADSERQAAQVLEDRAQQEVASLRERRAAAERERSDTALAAQTDQKLAAIAAEQKAADERFATAQARVERNRKIEESHEVARDLQRQYDEAIARGDKLQAARVRNRQDDHHDRSMELLQHDEVEKREMEAQAEVRNKVARQIRERAAIAAEASLVETVKVQDLKDRITSKTEFLSVGSEMQKETSKTTRMADRELAKAQATQQEVERMINDPSTTAAERKVALEMRDLALVQEEGARRLLTDNMKISAAGYAIDAAMTATGGTIIKGAVKGAGRLAFRAAGAVVGEQVLVTTAERMAARAGQRLARTEAAKFVARKQAERIATQSLTKPGAAAASEEAVAQLGNQILEARGVEKLYKTATKEILNKRGVLDLAGTGVTRVATTATGLVSDDAAKWVGRTLATDVGTPIANVAGRATRAVVPEAVINATTSGLRKAGQIAATDVTEIPGKIRAALDGAAHGAPAVPPGSVQAAVPDRPLAPTPPPREVPRETPSATPAPRPDAPAPDSSAARPAPRPTEAPATPRRDPPAGTSPAATPAPPSRPAPDASAARPAPRPTEAPATPRRDPPAGTSSASTPTPPSRPAPDASAARPAPRPTEAPATPRRDPPAGTSSASTPTPPSRPVPDAPAAGPAPRPAEVPPVARRDPSAGTQASRASAADAPLPRASIDELVRQKRSAAEALRKAIDDGLPNEVLARSRDVERLNGAIGEAQKVARAGGETLPPSGTGLSSAPSSAGPASGPSASASAPRAAFTQDEVARLHEPGRVLTPAETARRQELFKQRNGAHEAYDKAEAAGRPAAELEALGRQVDELENAIEAGRKAAYRAADPPGFRDEIARLHEPGRVLTPAEVARKAEIYKQHDDAYAAAFKAEQYGRSPAEIDALGREADRLGEALAEGRKAAARAGGETLPPSGTGLSSAPSSAGPASGPSASASAPRAAFTQDEIARLHEPGRVLTPAETARRQELFKQRNNAYDAYHRAEAAGRPATELDALARDADRLQDVIDEGRKAANRAADPPGFRDEIARLHEPGRVLTPAEVARKAEIYKQHDDAYAAAFKAEQYGRSPAEIDALGREADRLGEALAEGRKAAARAGGETLPPSGTGLSSAPSSAGPASGPSASASAPRAAFTQDEVARLHEPGRVLTPAETARRQELFKQRNGAHEAYDKAEAAGRPAAELEALGRQVDELENAIEAGRKAAYRAADPPGFRDEIARLHEPGRVLTPAEVARKAEIYKQHDDAYAAAFKAEQYGRSPAEIDALGREADRLGEALAEGRKAAARAGGETLPPSGTGLSSAPSSAGPASGTPSGPGASTSAPRAAFTQDEIVRLHEPGRVLTPAETARRQELFKQYNDAALAHLNARGAGRPAAEVEALGRRADELDNAIEAGRKAANRAADPPGFREEIARLHEPGRVLTPAELARRDAIYKQRDDAVMAHQHAKDVGRPRVEIDALGRQADRLGEAIEEGRKVATGAAPAAAPAAPASLDVALQQQRPAVDAMRREIDDNVSAAFRRFREAERLRGAAQVAAPAGPGVSAASRAVGQLADDTARKRADWLSIPENVRTDIAHDADAALRRKAIAGDESAQRVVKALDNGSLKIELEPGLKTPSLSLENGRAIVNPMDGPRVRSGNQIANLLTPPPSPPVRLSSSRQKLKLDSRQARHRDADGLLPNQRSRLEALDKREAQLLPNVRPDVMTTDDLARMGDSKPASIVVEELKLDSPNRQLTRDAQLEAIHVERRGILTDAKQFREEVALRQSQMAAPAFAVPVGSPGASRPQANLEWGGMPHRQLVPGDKAYLADIMKQSGYVIGQGDVFVNSINKHVQQMINGGFPLPRNPGPIQVRMLPSGKFIVEDGHHRLIAAVIASRLTGRRLLPHPANPAADSIIPHGHFEVTTVEGHVEADWNTIGVKLGDDL